MIKKVKYNIDINSHNLIAITGPNRSNKTLAQKNIYSSLKDKDALYIDNDYSLLDRVNSNIKYILIDNLCSDTTKKRTKEIINAIKKYSKDITIIVATINLDLIVNFDYIYVLDKDKIYLEGKPSDILVLDNKLSRLGLSLPFMYDLSVKLNDYNILDDIITDMDRMVEEIWR